MAVLSDPRSLVLHVVRLKGVADAAAVTVAGGFTAGEVERLLDDDRDVEPPPEVPVSSNGHGEIEVVVAAA